MIIHNKTSRFVILNEVKDLFKIPRYARNDKLFVHFLNLLIYSRKFKKKVGKKEMIAVIDYGAGNLQSVVKALNYINCDCIITDKENFFKHAQICLEAMYGFAELK